MIQTKKTTQDILQEEMLRERVAVLARAGERLAEALDKLQVLESDIEAKMAALRTGEESGRAARCAGGRKSGAATGKIGNAERGESRQLLGEFNAKIRAYNRQRDHVLTRYYYLIVTREALGLIHHQRLDEIYKIPPKKRCLPEG